MLKTWYSPGPWLMLILFPLPLLLSLMSLGTPAKLSHTSPRTTGTFSRSSGLKTTEIGKPVEWQERQTVSTALNLSTQGRQTSQAADSWCHYQIVNYQLAQPWQEIVRHCQTSGERQNLLTALPLSAPVWQLWAALAELSLPRCLIKISDPGGCRHVIC